MGIGSGTMLQFYSGINYDIFIVKIIVQNDINASPFIGALRCKPSDTFDHSSGQVFPGLVVSCFFVNLP